MVGDFRQIAKPVLCDILKLFYWISVKLTETFYHTIINLLVKKFLCMGSNSLNILREFYRQSAHLFGNSALLITCKLQYVQFVGLPINRHFSLGFEAGADLENLEGERKIRTNVIMLRGVDDLSTEDIFEYLNRYPPRKLEWIDDTSCRSNF